MEKIININHGLPQSPYFVIAQVKKTYGFARTEGDSTIVNLTDPKTKQPIKATLEGVWTMDKKEFLRSKAFSLLAYGCDPSHIYKGIMDKNPDLKDGFEVEYWLLKKMD